MSSQRNQLTSKEPHPFTTLAQRTLTKAIGDPDQIAATHLYLMKNRFVTGTVFTVDGGFILTGN